jgi:hypothetical protein
MTNDLSTRTTKIRNLAGAALVALVTLMTLSLVAPSAAQAATQTASVNPSTAAAGAPVTVTGSGFLPAESVDVMYGGSTIASGVADASGDFSVSGAIPGSMPEGGHPMDVVGSMGSMVSFSYTVAPTPPSTTAPAAPASPSPAPAASPAAPATPSPAPSTTAAPAAASEDTSDDSADPVADDDGENELALGETAGRDDESAPNALLWVLVIVVLTAAGLGVFLVLRRSEAERA